MSVTSYDNYIGKLVLNTNNARIEGKQYVFDNVNLPVVNVADKSVIDVESCYKNGGLSNVMSRQIAMSNLSPPLMHTGYGFSNMYGFHTDYTQAGQALNALGSTEWIYFTASNTSPYYRFKFSSNVPVNNIATLAGFESSANGSNWRVMTSNFPTASTSNASVVPITEHYLNLIDVRTNGNAVFRPARLWFAGGNTWFQNATAPYGSPNDYQTFFNDYGFYNYMYFYIPSVNVYVRLRWTEGSNTFVRNTQFWRSYDGGITWKNQLDGGMGEIPFSANGSVFCDCIIIERRTFPVTMYNGGTIVNLTNFTNPTTYDSSTTTNTRQLDVIPTPLANQGKVKPNFLYYQSISKPIMFNYGTAGFPLRFSFSTTLDSKKEYFLPYGDNVQITLKLFKHDDNDGNSSDEE